jgi:diguanylate cyclase (GGDEF)-like protein/PAS domain S-box-containing protein
VTGVIGTSRDVTTYSARDRELAIAETRYKLVVEAMPAVTCLYSVTSDVQSYDYVSPQVEQILGFTPDEFARLWSMTPDLAVHPDDSDRFKADAAQLVLGHGSVTLEYRHHMKNGGWKWVRELVSPLPGDSPDHRRRQSILFDLTEDRALTERLEHQVFHDALTGLPNRALLSKRLDEALTRSSSTQRPFALLFVDLDGFKTINDSMGHHVGDAALIAVAERLRHLTRAGDTVTRFGGDEFIILLAEISGASDVNEIAARVQRAFLRPFEVDGASIRISPSIGISVHSRADGTSDEMLREADAAMYAAKRAGRGQTRVFDPAADMPLVGAGGSLADAASRN